jgi:alkanesulfonate monooxygenase SsuD/methylene tetrahydromethanopterin reductase-like flavin-dependent oxidoreductase (luciferase family)
VHGGDSLTDQIVLYGYLAALTSLEPVTGVIILPQRQTAVVAKQAAEVDLLTGGRFRLGVGLAGTRWSMRRWARTSAIAGLHSRRGGLMDSVADRFLGLIHDLEDVRDAVTPERAHAQFDELTLQVSG